MTDRDLGNSSKSDDLFGNLTGRDNVFVTLPEKDEPSPNIWASTLNDLFDETVKTMTPRHAKALGASIYLLKERMLPPEYRRKPEAKPKSK